MRHFSPDWNEKGNISWFEVAEKSVRAAEWQEILRAFDRFLKAAEKLLQIFAAFDEIDFGSVDDQQVGTLIAKEKMFVGARDFLDVIGRDLLFLGRFFLGDACAKHFRFGLQIDDKIRFRELDSKGFVIALIELQFGIVEVEVGEDAVFFHQVIGNDRSGSVARKGFPDALLALHQEIQLSVKGRTGLFRIEIAEKRVVFAVINAAGVEAFGQDAGEGGLADPQRSFDNNELRGFRAGLWLACAFRRENRKRAFCLC